MQRHQLQITTPHKKYRHLLPEYCRVDTPPDKKCKLLLLNFLIKKRTKEKHAIVTQKTACYMKCAFNVKNHYLLQKSHDVAETKPTLPDTNQIVRQLYYEIGNNFSAFIINI